MTAPTYFTVIGDFKSIVADTLGDTDADPDTVSLLATVTFTPVINDGDLILATTASPRPTAFVAAPISGFIDTDGILKMRAAGASGASGFSYTPVRLLADTPLLELAGDLFYSVTFSNVSYNGRFINLTGFTFQAPTSDVVLNLVTVARAPGQPATSITKIAPTGVRFTGGNMVFSFSGVDIPEPLPLASITGPQGPQGPQGIQGQAGVSLDINGTVSTYANLPSSADDGEAYVVAADGKLYYRFDGVWPADGDGVPFVGPQGPQGPQGSVGATGATGQVGATGASGLQGEVGATGATGPVGATGATGLAGQSVSLKGAVATYSLLPGSASNGDGYILLTDNLLYVWNGSWPSEGSGVPFVGPAGATGASGPPGATGASGLQGEVGATGATGATGASGASGLQGEVGATGASGLQGASGPAGPAGATGASGPAGATGASGIPGIARSVSTMTTSQTLSAGTDYVVYANIATAPTDQPEVVTLLHADGANNSTTITNSAQTVSTNWTASGNARLSTSVSKFGTASISFNGTNSAITAPGVLFGGNFTVEFWFYTGTTGGTQRIVDDSRITILVSGSTITAFSDASEVLGSSSFSADTWTHVALTRSGTTARFFVNGILIASGTTAGGASEYPLVMGSSYVKSGNWYLGNLDEIRVSTTAKYTSNFTPQTQAFSDPTPIVTPTLTLPTAVSNTNIYRINNIHSSEALTVATTSSQTIDGESTASLTIGTKATYISNGSNWRSW